MSDKYPGYVRTCPLILAKNQAGSWASPNVGITTAMEIPDRSYYSDLRRSADQLFEMDIMVVPAMNFSIEEDDYTGLEEFNDWRDNGCDPSQDPNQFGLEGDEITGSWNEDGSIFEGFFPAYIQSDSSYYPARKFRTRSAVEVHRQIDLAEEFGLALGIAANTFNIKNLCDRTCRSVNSVAMAYEATFRSLFPNGEARIETNGSYCWVYADVDYEMLEIKLYQESRSEVLFGLNGKEGPRGEFVKSKIVPAYPSIVGGKQIRLLSPGKGKAIWVVTTAKDAGVRFDVELSDGQPTKTESTILNTMFELPPKTEELDESLEWIHTPDEEEALFQRSMSNYEALTKPSKEIKRLKNPEVSPQQDASGALEPEDINLNGFLPSRLSDAIAVVKEHLPYDNLSVLVSFLTGVASMLRLGTTVTGNELTDYTVPVNLYTILRARSGRKKSALQKLFVEEPAGDVMLRLAQENDRTMKAWQEDCRGKSNSEKPAQPVPVMIRANDYTGEAFVQQLGKLDEVGRAILVMREEIAGLFQSLNAHRGGKGADEQQLLELYDGRGYRSLRISDKSRGFSRASVSIYGTIQPDVLDDLLRNGDASGLWARFCFVDLPDMTRPLPTDGDPEKLRAFKEGQQCLRDVISGVYELAVSNYKLDSEAMKLFSNYEHKKQQDAMATTISSQASLYGKSAGKVLRFAGLLHIVERVVMKLPGHAAITAATLMKAIELVDRQDRWTLGCHAKLVGVTRAKLTPFQRRLHTIALKSKAPTPWSSIRQQMSSKEKDGMNAGQAEKEMQVLVNLGLGEISKGPNGGICYKAIKPL